MAKMISNLYAERYAEQLSSKICDQFFKDKNCIKGKDILELTQIKQLNLLIIKNIFFSWQSEASKLESPYFDYSTEEVQKALNNFMNVLSRNILVEKDDFEVILKSSIIQTLTLAVDPAAYFSEFLEAFSKKVNIEKELKPAFKYVKINKKLADEIVEGLAEEGDKVKAKKAQKIVEKICKGRTDLEDYSALFKEFDALLPINEASLVFEKEEEFFVPTEEEELEKIHELEDVYFEEKAQIGPDQEQILENSQEDSTISFDDLSYFEAKTEDKTNAITPPPIPQEEIKKPKVELVKEDDDEDDTTPASLHDKLKSTVVESHQEKASVLDRIAKVARHSSLKGNIPLNLKFKFQNELFNGSALSLNEAIDTIDKSEDYHSAMRIVRDNFLEQYNWDLSNETTIEFLNLVTKSFNVD